MSKDGDFTMFPNKILAALMSYHFTPMQLEILLFIARYSYGFRREHCDIGLTKLQKATGRAKRRIRSTISDLVALNVIGIENEPTNNRARTVYIKDPNEWDRCALYGAQGTEWCTGDSTVHRGEDQTVHRGRGPNGAQGEDQTVHTGVHQTVHTINIKDTSKDTLKENIKKENPCPDGQTPPDDEEEHCWLDDIEGAGDYVN